MEEDIKRFAKKETKLKNLIVDYIGNKLNPENGEITIEMCIHIFNEEFPELLLLLAQENFLRGYQQCLDDMNLVENDRKKNLKTL